MEKIRHQTHNRNTLIYALSMLLERTAYYGFRALIVLYLMNEMSNFEREDVLEILGWFMLYIIFTKIIGAVLGDLVIGNKKALIVGGILQILGFLCMLQPSLLFMYIGFGLIAIGNGLYAPNMLAEFGKNYLDKQKLLDAAFTIHYTAIHIGSNIGIVLIAYIGEIYGFTYGFALSALLMLIATVLLIFNTKIDEIEFPKSNFIIRDRAIIILIIILFVALFRGFYGIGLIKTVDIEFNTITLFSFEISSFLLQSINSQFVIGMSILASIFWTFYYNNQIVKLALGFLFITLGLALFFLIPDTVNEQNVFLYFIAILLIAIAEVCIAPVVQSILTQYVNPKYLAIAFSLAFLPNGLFTYIFSFGNDYLYNNFSLILMIVVVSCAVICLGLFGFSRLQKTNIK
jgi:POT family proton-dependent oligopeptide transporter